MSEFHDFSRSSAAYRVRIALALKGLDPRRRPVDLVRGEQHEADFRALNPQGLVPVYSDDAVHLTQSLAIIEYLDERYPQPPLLPTEPAARARARQFAQIICSDMHPLNGYRVLLYLRDNLGADLARRRQWFQHWLLEGLDALELWLTAAEGRRTYCVGEHVTLADVCLVPILDLARRNGLDVEDFPRLVAVERACLELPAFRETHPDALDPR